ncbi:TetR/AcrR family transcriptional regulator (plasmid) [Variovorax sp. 375MFSha3.1]|uniref:TetR/AcrR family transcriptional regulator n=1 Tax=unclassified Variovorax TaxID=663243 RepID=UPI003AADD61E
MPGRPSPSSDRLTQQKIIDSALALYAEKGIDGVPVRALTSHAGVNVAAIHYHFGSTEALAEAVFGELSARVNKRRTRALQELTSAAEATGHKPDVEDIVDAFVAPYVGPDAATEGQLLAQLILKHRLVPSAMTERVIKKHFDPMAKQFVAALHDAVPEIPLELMYLRYMLMVSTVVLSLSDRGRTSRLQRLSGSKATAADRQTIRTALIDFIVGGIRAPASG